MKFDYSGDVPLFQQVANEITQLIFMRIYQDGDQIPSTTEISNGYQINPATILKGINLLVDEGIVEKRRGMGVFVTPQALEIVRKKREDTFRYQSLSNFISQAKALGLTKEKLLSIIEKEYDK